MKKSLLFLCILISIRSYSQQPFAPPGAVWHYDFGGVGSGGFVKIEADSDSIIQGINCRKLELNVYEWYLIGPNQYGFSLNPQAPEFVYQNGDTVFWYTNNQFRVLYNFSSQPGSLWVVTDSMPNGFGWGGCDSLSQVAIDSTGIENINGENLRYLTVHPDGGSPLGFGGRIYERLGSTNFLFPIYAHCDTGIIVDAPFYWFHCYEDSTFSLYNADTSDCEWYWVLSTGETISEENSFTVFPNPADDEISLNCKQEIKLVSVWNIQGEKMIERNINSWIRNYKIDISSLPQGLYMIAAETNAGQFTRRFIKQ